MKRSYIMLLLGVIAISFAAVLIRLADAPPVVIAFYRMAITAACLIPLLAVTWHGKANRLTVRQLWLVVGAGLLLAVHFGLWITSLEYTSISSSVVLVTSHPAFVAVMAYLIFKERIGGRQITGIIVAMIGVVIINLGGFEFNSAALAGNIMALMAGFAMGGYLIIGRRLKNSLGIVPYLLLVNTVGAILLLPVLLISGTSLVHYSINTFLVIALIALVPQLIGHSCINLAVRYLPATVVSVAILFEPFMATALAWLLLGEAPLLYEVAGGLVIVAGIFMVLRYGDHFQPQT